MPDKKIVPAVDSMTIVERILKILTKLFSLNLTFKTLIFSRQFHHVAHFDTMHVF